MQPTKSKNGTRLHATDRQKPLSVKILPMSEEDIDEVIRIERLSFPNPWTRGFFERELRNPISYAFVEKIEEKGRLRLAGYIVFWIVTDEAHILNIAVDPELRRQGLAKRLLCVALSFMEDRGVDVVHLEVRRSNTPAINLYRRFGFEEVYIRENYYGNEDAIVMRLVFRHKSHIIP